MRLPPLTRHAFDISGDFPSLREIVDGYAAGAPGRPARVQETMAAVVISSLFHKPDCGFEWERHLPFPDRCARLLYAVLYARWGHLFAAGTPEAEAARPAFEALDGMASRLDAGLDGGRHHLFISPYASPAVLRTPESERAHLVSAMPMGDIHKMVPGLAAKNPAWAEPDMPEIVPVPTDSGKRRRSRSRPFSFALLAQ